MIDGSLISPQQYPVPIIETIIRGSILSGKNQKADGITISDMGSMGNMGGKPDITKPESNSSEAKSSAPRTSDGENVFAPSDMPSGEMPETSDGKEEFSPPDMSDGKMPQMPDGMNMQEMKTNITETVIVSTVSIIILILGILFALFYRRRK